MLHKARGAACVVDLDRKAVGGKDAVAANGALIHAADLQRQGFAEPFRVIETFASVDGADQVRARGSGFLLVLNEGQHLCALTIGKHGAPTVVPALEEISSPHNRRIAAIGRGAVGVSRAAIAAWQVGKELLQNRLVIGAAPGKWEAAQRL